MTKLLPNGVTWNENCSVIIPPKPEGHDIPFIENYIPSGVHAAGEAATISEVLNAAECVGFKFGKCTRVLDMRTSVEVKENYPNFAPKKYETTLLTNHGEVIHASVLGRKGNSGEYYAEKGEILIRTCRAVEGRRVKDTYYAFTKGGEKFELHVLMCVAFLGMQRKVGLEGDHINQDTNDDRIENLRAVTGVVNRLNVKRIDYRKKLVDFLMI